MTWLILTQLLILSFLTYKKKQVTSPEALRSAWNWFGAVFFVNALFTVFRAGNYDSMDLALVEIWANGIIWFCLGVSIIKLPTAVLGYGGDSFGGEK